MVGSLTFNLVRRSRGFSLIATEQGRNGGVPFCPAHVGALRGYLAQVCVPNRQAARSGRDPVARGTS